MTTSRWTAVSACRDFALSTLFLTAVALAAAGCSSGAQGLKANDGGLDATARIDVGVVSEAGMGQGGVGGTTAGLDAAGEAGGTLPGSGGMPAIDAGAIGRGGSSGTGGAGGRWGTAGSGGFARGSGGVGGSATTRVLGGTGGSARLDAALVPDAGIDAPHVSDGPLDSRPGNGDTWSARSDAVAVDGSSTCGALDQPCCEDRACDAPDLVCTTGGAGGGGTCSACGGDGEPCCEGDVCTAAGTTCIGGHGGGTCH